MSGMRSVLSGQSPYSLPNVWSLLSCVDSDWACVCLFRDRAAPICCPSLAAGRREVLHKVCLEAPSSLAKSGPSAVPGGVTCYRNGTTFHPVTLYSPALGLLGTDAWRMVEVPAEVLACAVTFVNTMNKTYASEDLRQAEILGVLHSLLPTDTVDAVQVDRGGGHKCATDGTIIRGGIRVCNVEVKNEIGHGGDATLQNVGYYAAFARQAGDVDCGVAPMVGVSVVGNLLAFSGFVLVGGRLVVEPLTDLVFTCCTYASYVTVGKMFVALKAAVDGLVEVRLRLPSTFCVCVCCFDMAESSL